VAALMEQHNIKRVPVTHEGIIFGIISRSDLLRVIVAAKLDDTAPGDAAIRRSLLTRFGDDNGVDGSRLGVTVSNGVVHLWGTVTSENGRDAVRVIAEGIRGVVGTADHIQVVPGRNEAADKV
jgi:CBS domain-containing protein